MKRRYSKKPAEQREIAEERIRELFRQAELRLDKGNEKITGLDKSLADRYVALARKISMKYKVKIPRNLKRRFCKHCYCYLKPGFNCRVRLAKKRVIYYCLGCRKFMRFVYKGSKKR